VVPSVAPTSRSSNAVNHQGLWGLRGLAAGLLLLPHVAVVVYDFNPPVGIAQWATLSTAFVHIFLIQSAYLLGRGFIRRQAAGQPPASTRAFLWGRGTRIYPGYWLMLVIAVPIMHLAIWSNPIDTLAAFFAVNVYSIPALLSAPIMVWCLQVVVGFYLLLPVHDRLSRKLLGPGRFAEGPLLTLLVMYAVIGLLFVTMVYVGGWKVGYTWPFAYLNTFALGLGLAVVDISRPAGVPGSRRPRLNANWSLFFSILILAILLASRLDVEAVNITEPVALWQSLLRRFANDLAAFFLVAAFVFPDGRRTVFESLLTSRPGIWLGQRSFQIYLWNIPVIIQLDRWFGPGGTEHLGYLPLLAMSYVSCFVVAEVAHRLTNPVVLWLRTRGPGSSVAPVASAVG
jgi:peptidoglycan/LPS O-acetylase OafA/YrhL